MKRGVPTVNLTMSRPDIDVPRVTSDHEAIGRIAAEHFLKWNFRNAVWFSTGSRTWNAADTRRPPFSTGSCPAGAPRRKRF